MSDALYRYDAFISYRHKKDDTRWARWLIKALETYRVPKRLANKLRLPPKFKLRVFRDEDELPTSATLSDSIDQALQASRFLIVVCSPDTPESKWVGQEIRRFREMDRGDRILALLVRGEPSESFPEPLRFVRKTVRDGTGVETEIVEEVEPLAGDVRSTRKESQRFLRRMAKLRLLAALLGCSFDDLRQRDAERRRKQRALQIGFSATALLVAGILTVVGLGRIREARTGETARFLAEQAALLEEQEPERIERAALLAVESMRLQPSLQAHEVLRRTAYQLLPRAGVLDLGGLVWNPVFSPTGKLMAAVTRADDSSPFTLHVLDSRTLTEVSTATFDLLILEVAFSEDEKRIVTLHAREGTTIFAGGRLVTEIRDVGTGALAGRVEHEPYATGYRLSPGGQYVAMGTREGEVVVEQVATGRRLFGMALPRIERNTFSFSADGRHLAIASGDNDADSFAVTVALLDGSVTWRAGLDSRASGVWLGPGARHVVVATTPAEVWDTQGNRRIATLGGEGTTTSAAFSPDGRYVAVGSSAVHVVRLDTGLVVTELPHYGFLRSMAFAPDGNALAIASNRMSEFSPSAVAGEKSGTRRGTAVIVYDAKSGRRVGGLSDDEPAIYVAFSPDGSRIVTEGASARYAVMWDRLAPGATTILSLGMPVLDVGYGRDGRRMHIGGAKVGAVFGPLPRVSVSRKKAGETLIRLVDTSDARVVGSIPGQGVWADLGEGAGLLRTSLRFDGFGCVLEPGGDPDAPAIPLSSDESHGLRDDASKSVRRQALETCAVWDDADFTSDGKYVLLRQDDSGGDRIRIRERGSGRIVRTLIPIMKDTHYLARIAATPDFSCIARVGTGGVEIWSHPVRPREGNDDIAREPDRFQEYGKGIDLNRYVVSREGQVLAVVGGGLPGTWIANPTGMSAAGVLGKARSGDYEGLMDLQKQFQAEQQKAMAEKVSPVALFSLCDGEPLAAMDLSGGVLDAALSSSGDVFAAATHDGIVHVFSSRTGDPVARLEHDVNVTAVALSAAGEYAAVGTEPGAILVWDLRNGRQIARLAHEAEVTDLEFSPDDTSLLSGSEDGTARIWEWRPERMIERAHAGLARNLSEEEWTQYFPGEDYRKTFPDRP